MKTVLLFLLVFLATSASAETFVPYTPGSLKKGDYLTIESVRYYPYIAPGLKEEVPWRAENIRKVLIQATVTDKSADALTIEFTLKNLYDCRNVDNKPGFYYFDSHYQKDFGVEDNVPGKQLSRVTYDWKSGKVLTVESKNISYSYPKAYIPFGVRQVFTADNIFYSYPRAYIPSGARQEGVSSNPVVTVQDSLNMDKLLTPIINNLLTGWKEDGAILPATDARIVEASFPLPPNTEFTCHYFAPKRTSQVLTVHKKLFIPYPTEYKVAKGRTLLLTPGDSITQDKEELVNTHVIRYQGRGNEQNNFQYGLGRFANKGESRLPFYDEVRQPEQMKQAYQSRDSLFQAVIKKDFEKMNPYWRMVFERSEQYLKAGVILQIYIRKDTDKEAWHKSGLLDWQAPHFASVNPLIDLTYSLTNSYAGTYNYFLYEYAAFKKQELLSDNLSLNKQKEFASQEDYILNKQIFSGYPKYFINAVNLETLMYNKMMLCDIEDDYNDFITSCPDTSLTNGLKKLYKKLLPFEAGNNIRETDFMIADSLPLKKGSDRKYILLYLNAEDGLPANELQAVLDCQKLLETEGLSSTVQLKAYASFSSHNTKRVKPYKAIPEEQKKYLTDSLRTYTMAILMREDGTILHRQAQLTDTKKILDTIRKDMNRPKENTGILNFIYGCITALLLALCIFYLYRLQMKAKQKQEQTRRQIRELELRAIRSQMNPHFIFNALSSIQNLINRSANKEAGEYLVNFSRLVRKVLTTSEKKLVSLSDEIEQIQLYLKLEQLRFPFSYSVSVAENIEPEVIEIPGMLIQPFVENAVKHGIAPRGSGEINIRLSLQNQQLVIDITDDGPGIAPDNRHEGFGIRAISQQFELLKTVYNTEIDIKIENRQDKDPAATGCHVRLSIPL